MGIDGAGPPLNTQRTGGHRGAADEPRLRTATAGRGGASAWATASEASKATLPAAARGACGAEGRIRSRPRSPSLPRGKNVRAFTQSMRSDYAFVCTFYSISSLWHSLSAAAGYKALAVGLWKHLGCGRCPFHARVHHAARLGWQAARVQEALRH